MSRIASPAEKTLAIAAIYRGLMAELESHMDPSDPFVQAQMLESATRIGMATDTRDMGVMLGVTPSPDPLRAPDEDDGDHYAGRDN